MDYTQVQNIAKQTIDLSPQCGDIWGDFARTIIVENGVVIENLNDIVNSEWKMGLRMEDHLHQEMRQFVTRDTTFEPHIGISNSKYGYKKENIYFFDREKVKEL